MPDLAESGGAKVARALSAAGVRVVFTLCGGHISPILVEAKRAGITVIDVRDEATAAFAADGMSRLTGTAGVAVVTAGPGVTNTLTAIKNAQLAQSPLVILGGATATVLKGRGSLQDIDQMALVGPHVKWKTAVKRVADLESAVLRAMHEAQRGVPGPVFVECPVDLLYPEDVVRGMFLSGFGDRAPRSVGERAMRWYLDRHLTRTFASGPASDRPAPPPARAQAPTSPDAHLDRIAQKVTGAERPVILVGSQAMTGEDPGRLASAVSALGLPVYLSGMARGLLGASHPLQFRHQRKQALREADLVILAGTPCDFRLEYGRQINARATLIAINRSSRDLNLNRHPTFGVLGSPCATLERLVPRLAPGRGREQWLQTLSTREHDRDEQIAARSRDAVSPLNPLAVCRAIDAQLGPSSIVIADGGDFVATASYIVRPRAPLSWLDPGVFGTLGVGAGFILAAHASRPDADIWAIYGDGALGFSLVEFDTFVRHRVGVVAVVGNDGKWAQITRDQVAVLGDDVATVIGRTDYHRVVEGFGAVGMLADDPSSFVRTLSEARAIARTGRPVLVNALIGDTDFRKGSISL